VPLKLRLGEKWVTVCVIVAMVGIVVLPLAFGVACDPHVAQWKLIDEGILAEFQMSRSFNQVVVRLVLNGSLYHIADYNLERGMPVHLGEYYYLYQDFARTWNYLLTQEEASDVLS
jgi:hypothetical protein